MVKHQGDTGMRGGEKSDEDWFISRQQRQVNVETA